MARYYKLQQILLLLLLFGAICVIMILFFGNNNDENIITDLKDLEHFLVSMVNFSLSPFTNIAKLRLQLLF